MATGRGGAGDHPPPGWFWILTLLFMMVVRTGLTWLLCCRILTLLFMMVVRSCKWFAVVLLMASLCDSVEGLWTNGGGCRYYTKESKDRVDSHKVDAVDTTGAGDAFVAGLLNSLASDPTLYKEEEKLREALVFANGCGALTVMEKGAIPSLPTKEKTVKVASW
ncbi:uncharacterized protein LOC114266528 [Camellia sinensis]|uniref:uncharacterized protein LOC114266528 n=1 Tax=Camellia sinensis TaxID=4442 RepID=UPI001035E0D4|nr:uncharacterized protein LOC114266528 [Camellia sinensis]